MQSEQLKEDEEEGKRQAVTINNYFIQNGKIELPLEAAPKRVGAKKGSHGVPRFAERQQPMAPPQRRDPRDPRAPNYQK